MREERQIMVGVVIERVVVVGEVVRVVGSKCISSRNKMCTIILEGIIMKREIVIIVVMIRIIRTKIEGLVLLIVISNKSESGSKKNTHKSS